MSRSEALRDFSAFAATEHSQSEQRALRARTAAHNHRVSHALGVLRAMALRWAEGGGADGSEMQDYRDACDVLKLNPEGE